MFGRKKYNVDLSIEGELQAMTVSRKDGLPEVNPEFDHYPVNMTLAGKRTLRQAVKEAMEYGKAGIYTIIYKGKRGNN